MNRSQLVANHRNTGRRRGITLIELLVIIAIVGILTALLISAVMSAREASRRAECANHLRQIGLALASYSTDIGIYPQGVNGKGYSVHTMLLPYFEQTNIYNQLNFSAICHKSMLPDAVNATVAQFRVAVFLCPADPLISSRTAQTSYAGNRGTGVQKYGYNGTFAFERTGPIGYSAFSDGTSTTAAMSEWVRGTQDQARPDQLHSTFETTETLADPEQFDRFVSECQSINPTTASVNRLAKGSSWLRGDFSFTLYNHSLGINEPTCTNGTAVQIGAWTAGSMHSRGCQTLFVDGHVQFLSSTTSLHVWRSMGSRAGGEVIGNDL